MNELQVSVVIPTYNCQNYIAIAIESVIRQNLPPTEIIVVDDGSTDDTAKIIRQIQNRSSIKISYFFKINGGLSSARNFGIQNCSTEYIAFLDSDDEWYEDKLEKQLNVFTSSELSNLGIVYCDFELINQVGVRTPSAGANHFQNPLRGKIFKQILAANRVSGSGSGVVVKKACFDKVGLFDESLSAAEDWDMWIRISEFYEFDFADRILVRIRRHDTNMQSDNERMFKNEIGLFKKWSLKLSQDQIPEVWIATIVEFVISDFPKANRLNYLFSMLPEGLEKKIFSRHKGSLKRAIFYYFSVKIYRQFRSVVKSLLHGTRHLYRYCLLFSKSFSKLLIAKRKNQ